MFTGKGGVGKTTACVAVSSWLAREGFKTLLLSADPAHSIGDSLGMKISNEPTVMTDISSNLFLMEIDGKHEYNKFKAYVKKNSKNNVDKFLTDAGLPGMNELASLFRVFTYVYDIRYDIIVLDTPPSGQTLDMLSLPDTLDQVTESVKNIIDNLNTWAKLFARPATNKANKRIDDIKGCVNKLKWLFANTNITSVNLVSTAEYMSLRESMRTYNELSGHGIKVQNILLNKLQPQPNDHGGRCMFCSTRRDQQLRYINTIENEFRPKGVDIVKINASPTEVVGSDMLLRVGDDIIHQLTDIIDVRQACVTQSPEPGQQGVVVQTQIPYVEHPFLKVRINENDVIFSINYGLHEDVHNVLNFQRPIQVAEPFNDLGNLSFRVV